MTGRGDPPEGTPEGVPGGGDDEYRSVVFDESFVNAARIEEFSAQERITDHTPAVRRRRQAVSGTSKQAIILIMLITLAFGSAIYLGVRQPYQQSGGPRAEPMRSSITPLTVVVPVPGGQPEKLFAHSPAADFRVGATGIVLPLQRSTEHFSQEQVNAALILAKNYIVRSSINPKILTEGASRSVRLQLDPDLQEQFDRSLARPVDDGLHAATGWMIRFDPEQIELADAEVRVDGSVGYEEVNPDELEITSDHTFVYALRSARDEDAKTPASLFTVRREVRIRFDRDDLRREQLRLAETRLMAGPLSCSVNQAGHLSPLLAGQQAERENPAGTDFVGGTDLFAQPGEKGGRVCGVLSASSQPSPAG